VRRLVCGALPLCIAISAFAQQGDTEYMPQDHRPPLFFREDFKPLNIPNVNERAINQGDLANPNLELKLYGPGKDLVYIERAENIANDPNWSFVWTGMTPGPWVVAFRHKNGNVDLTGLGKIRWRVEMTGFHQLQPVVKLTNGTWLVGDYRQGWTPDWYEGEFWPSFIRWRKFNIEKAAELSTGSRFTNGAWDEHPDLSKVEEIGFTDMMGGSGHGQGGWTRLDWIEVYGNPVKR
jgi:hypothetical protein